MYHIRWTTLAYLAQLFAVAASIGLKPEWVNNNNELYLTDVNSIQERDLVARAVDAKNSCKTRSYRKYLDDCQYSLMLRLTSYFETSKTDLGFAECSTTADGQGISAGFIQFTTCSGSALTVCETYEGLAKSNGKSTFCKKYLVPLRRTVGSCIFGGKEAITPPGLENFCKDWRAAAKDPLFQEAQQRIQFSSYFENLTPHFVNYNIKFPLTIAQMYDTSVQLGPGSIEKIANRATELSGGMPGKVDESWWLLNFFTARSEEWDRLGGAYPGTKYRVDAYRSMLTDKNWYFNFAKELKFTCWNTPTTLSCANKCNT